MFHILYTVSQKKQDSQLLVITMANIDQFSKLFCWTTSNEILHVPVIRDFHLKFTMLLQYLEKFENQSFTNAIKISVLQETSTKLNNIQMIHATKHHII